jgi:hypothetical protein
MEVSSDSMGRLKHEKNPSNPLEFGGITLYWFSYKS